MTQDDATRYQLPAEENRRIFAADIVPEQLTGPTPQDPATAVFLLGQPGAGKTRVAQLVAEQLGPRAASPTSTATSTSPTTRSTPSSWPRTIGS
ncbi:zeta toxin [Streptomyces sp. BK022]|nr:zeta toxin family protein [Streptomyces sp. BK022]RZU36687.1 zeta toxin [Streptomyces sp. BK022]